ncbi:acetyltransferase (GNAT) domain-containing protein [Ditylenchus destructor]|nr:acetyltransferase (GNAT) domain-containing protein [Ditylenchus destructor]
MNQSSVPERSFPEDWKVPPIPSRKIMEGRFVRLEPLDIATHGDALYDICTTGDAEERFTYLYDSMPKSRAEFQEWLTVKEKSNDPIYFVCVLKQTNEVAGRQVYMEIDPKNGVVEIGGIFWSSKMAGTSAATEAFYLFAKHVMDELGYRRFFWTCNTLNEPSGRAALRFGFTFEGALRQHMWCKGVSRDTAFYSIIDKEWPPIKKALELWLAPENFDEKGQQRRKHVTIEQWKMLMCPLSRIIKVYCVICGTIIILAIYCAVLRRHNFERKADSSNATFVPLTFNESRLAHQLLDGLKGVEIGASAQNPFGLNTLNVDFTTNETSFKISEKNFSGRVVKIDLLSYGDCRCLLPFPDESQDFVVSSHVIEHFYDPIGTILEWLRVVRPGGYVFMIVPHKDRTFDWPNNRTTLNELLERHKNPKTTGDFYGHQTFWYLEDMVELCRHFNWTVIAKHDVDDKVGNGFTVVIQKDTA